jgi:hypothetical protein
MSVVVNPSAREASTPRELAVAYEDFIERGPQYLDAETGIKASAYRYGERVLLVYQESEAGLVILSHATLRKRRSFRRLSSRILERFSKRMAPLVETRRVLSLLYSLNAEGSFLGKVHPFRERL